MNTTADTLYQNTISNRYYLIGVLVVLIQALQMYFYYQNPSLKNYFNSMLTIWISSKVFYLIVSLYITKNQSLAHKFKLILKTILFAEIITFVQEVYTEKERIKSTMLGLIGQIHVYALPIFLANDYIIIQQENNQRVNIQIYIQSIVNIIIISTCNILVQGVKNKIECLNYPILFQVYSFCRCFVFWHVLSQIYVINLYVLISWLIVQLLIDLIIVQNLEQDECKLASFVSYMFQLELFIIREKVVTKASLSPSQQFNFSYLDKQWSVVLYFFFLYFNIIFFIFIKIISQPILVQMDYLIYILFPLILPGLFWTIELIYNKIVKIENYNQIIGWRAGELSISKTMSKLKEDLINEGKIYIQLDEIAQQNNHPIQNYQNKIKKMARISTINSNQKLNQRLCDDIQDIKLGIKLASKGNFQNLNIQFSDAQQKIQFIISLDKNHNYHQKLILRQNYNQDLALKTLDLFQHLVNPDYHIDVEGKEMDIFKLRFQVIRFEISHFNTKLDLNDITLKILSNNFSTLAFYQQLSQFIPINPSMVLYDLLEDNI
ncbi:hypothetical protein ABPG72_015826 [Tetrahymena utriculariae]